MVPVILGSSYYTVVCSGYFFLTTLVTKAVTSRICHHALNFYFVFIADSGMLGISPFL